MPKPKKPNPFDVLGKPSDAPKRADLAADLCRDIDDAFSARDSIIKDGGLIDYANWYYEQGKSDAADLPFEGAADLTSFLITQDIDSLRARLMKAIFGVRPFCFVEGWGKDAKQAPYVEAFMDWQARKSDFKLEVGRVIHGGLLEDCFVLEVSEKVETRRLIETIDVAVETAEGGGAVFENGKPKLRLDPDGEPIPPGEGEAAATVQRTHTKTKRMGPQYDAISMKDFVFLPGHARGRKDVWGYAYRIFPRVATLKEQVEDGIYDAEAVENLGDQSDRDEGSIPSSVDSIVTNPGEGSAEKELIQMCLKRDLDGDGREEWYIATLSLKTRELLRLKLDSFAQKYGRWRCVPCVLFPRHNSVYGYSYFGHKLMTIAEEHTVTRNTKADRMTLSANAPIQRTSTAIWDPEAQPIGAGRIIDVRDHNELKMMDIRDVPTSVIEAERSLMGANERVSGLADASVVGVTSEDHRTATENKLIAGGSGVRVDEIVGHLHAFIAEVMAVSHAIWIETLESEKNGIDAPASTVAGLAQGGNQLADGRFTVDLLRGDFQFEPYGSDENSDPLRRRSDFNNKFVALANIGKVFPAVQQIFLNPEAAKAVLEEWARAYGVKDMQPFIGALMQPPAPPGMGSGALGPGVMGGPGAPAGGIPPEIMQLFGGLSTEGQPGGAY